MRSVLKLPLDHTAYRHEVEPSINLTGGEAIINSSHLLRVTSSDLSTTSCLPGWMQVRGSILGVCSKDFDGRVG